MQFDWHQRIYLHVFSFQFLLLFIVLVFYRTEIYIYLAMYFPTMVSFQNKYCVEAVLIKFVIFKFFTYDVYRTHTPWTSNQTC